MLLCKGRNEEKGFSVISTDRWVRSIRSTVDWLEMQKEFAVSDIQHKIPRCRWSEKLIISIISRVRPKRTYREAGQLVGQCRELHKKEKFLMRETTSRQTNKPKKKERTPMSPFSFFSSLQRVLLWLSAALFNSLPFPYKNGDSALHIHSPHSVCLFLFFFFSRGGNPSLKN